MSLSFQYYMCEIGNPNLCLAFQLGKTDTTVIRCVAWINVDMGFVSTVKPTKKNPDNLEQTLQYNNAAQPE